MTGVGPAGLDGAMNELPRVHVPGDWLTIADDGLVIHRKRGITPQDLAPVHAQPEEVASTFRTAERVEVCPRCAASAPLVALGPR